MGGKSSTTTQQVSIPPEVLARYNAVNARAEQAASTPFQPYSYNPADFVAQLTPTQLAGIQNINYAAGQAQPYYDEATGQLMGAQAAATPYYGAAADIYGQAYAGAQPMQDYSWNQLAQAGNIGQGLAQRGLSSIDYGQYAAAPLQDMAGQAYLMAYQNAQPINQYSLDTLARAGQIGEQLGTQSLGTVSRAAQIGEQLAGRSLGTLDYANYAATPLQQQAAQMYGGAYGQAQPLNQLALQQYFSGLGAAAPLSQQALENLAAGQQQGQQLTGGALSGLGAAQQAAYPYQQMATQYAATGAAPVSPGYLNTMAYMTPYMQNVISPTMALLNQQNQQAMAGQTANAIRSGAFGGDRAAIAAANLAQQQQLASSKVLGDLLQSGYGQALATAQQQQQLGLTAEQANRAAQAAAAQQMLGIGQQGFGQALEAARQQQTAAQQLFGQGATAAERQAALAQQLYGQQFGVGQGVQNIAQQLYAQGLGTGQAQQSLAQQLFGQGATTAQQQAAIAQQLFGQGATEAQQQAAMSQQLFGQGATSAQQQAAMAQQMYQQAMGLGQAQQGLGQQLFQQGLSAGQAQAGIGQQLFGQGAQQAQQQAALAQQRYQQGMGLGQAQQGIGQALYGMGAGTAQQLAALGQGAQAAALQGAQAQLAAGQAQQQTAQAGLQALYNQYLQQQGYPFQVAQFLANVAMGTGALSGSTTTTNQPGGLFSDARLKENIEEVGRTHDGQPIYKYNYKGSKKTEIGLIAQEVEKRHPEAVGEKAGYKTVDYDKATKRAGLGHVIDGEYTVKEGGHVHPEHAGLGFADGGMPYSDPNPTKLDIPDEKPDINKLELPGAPPKGRSAMEDIKDIASTAASIAAIAAASDARVKENIEEIGKLHDGQKVYRYNFKGDPEKHIGLIAQEVEHHQPKAVHEHNGLKMVDYDRATDVAARAAHADGGRAGYADGGVGLVSPADMAALLQAQAQMFGPYSQANRPIGGAPGAAGFVPAGNLPVSGLAVARELPRQASTLEQVKQLGDIGKTGVEIYKKGEEEGWWGKDKDKDKETTPTKSHGGLAGRKGYADGLSVYGEENPDLVSFDTRDSGGGETLFDRLTRFTPREGTEPTASRLTRLTSDRPAQPAAPAPAALNAQSTGRTGATGSWEDQGILDRLGNYIFENSPISPLGVIRGASWMPSGETSAKPAATSQATSAQTAPVAGTRAPSGPTPEELEARGLAAAARESEASARRLGMDQRSPDWVNQLKTSGAPGLVVPEKASGLANVPGAAAQRADVNLPSPVDAATLAAATPAGGGLAGQRPAVTVKPGPSKFSQFLEWAKKPENFIPLATGITGTIMAPTRNPLVAAAYGLQSGVQAYQPTQRRQAEIDQARAEALAKRVSIPKGAIFDAGGVRYYMGADGKPYTPSEWKAAGRPPLMGGEMAAKAAEDEAARMGVTPTAAAPTAQPTAAPGAPAAQPSADPNAPDAQALQIAAKENDQMMDLPAEQRALKADANQRIINNAYAQRNEAIPLGNVINESSRALMPMFKAGPLTAGAGIEQRAQFFNVVNTALRALGFTPSEAIDSSLTDQQVAQKFSTLLAGQRAQSLNQEAYAALQTLQGTVANGTMTESAVARILADLYVGNQRNIDFANYLDKYAGSQPDSIIANRALGEFQRQRSEQYETDRKMLEGILTRKDTKTGEPLINYLLGVGQDKELQRQFTPKYIEKNFPGVMRYIYRK